jgi:hypothetical protein
MLAGAVDKFYMLKYGLGVVLIFVGLKMVALDSLSGGKFPIGISLGFIALVIGASVALSLLFPKKEEPEDEGERLVVPTQAGPVEVVVHDPPEPQEKKKRFSWKSVGLYLLVIGLVVLIAFVLAKY